MLWADFKSFADRTPWTQLVPPVAVAAVGASGVPGDDDGKVMFLLLSLLLLLLLEALFVLCLWINGIVSL